MTQKTLEEYIAKQIAEEMAQATADPTLPEDMKLKRMLLQKYGVVPPQLTEEEQIL